VPDVELSGNCGKYRALRSYPTTMRERTDSVLPSRVGAPFGSLGQGTNLAAVAELKCGVW